MIPALEKLYKKSASRLSWASFFIAYPFWTVVQNVSFFLTLRFILTARHLPIDIIRIRSLLSFFALLLMFGAINSTIGAGINLGFDYFNLAIKVLPNYLYWGLLIIIIGNLGLRVMPLEKFYESFFYGIVFTTFTYYFLISVFDPIPFFRNVSQNNFAFLLIIFGPMATAHVQKKWGNNLYTLIFIILISLAGFLSGSRSGSIFTLVGCSLVLTLGNWIKTIIVLFIGVFLSVATPEVIETPAVKTTIRSLNERTYDLVYETEETMITDRSYLTRLAMIEKGMNIFEEYPIAGIGIGNFSNKSFKVDFNFEGADLLMHKEDEFERSVNPHNSYISFLSEGGLVLFIPFLLCLFYPIYYFIVNFNQIKHEEKAIFISIIFMCIHSWFITGMVNVYGWFILGVANSYIIHRSKAKKIIINDIRVSLPQ